MESLMKAAAAALLAASLAACTISTSSSTTSAPPASLHESFLRAEPAVAEYFGPAGSLAFEPIAGEPGAYRVRGLYREGTARITSRPDAEKPLRLRLQPDDAHSQVAIDKRYTSAEFRKLAKSGKQ